MAGESDMSLSNPAEVSLFQAGFQRALKIVCGALSMVQQVGIQFRNLQKRNRRNYIHCPNECFLFPPNLNTYACYIQSQYFPVLGPS